MTLSYIDYVVRNICLDHKDGILVSTYIKALALSYGIELCTIVLSHYLSERIFLIAGLLYMLAAAPVCLGLESDIIFDRL